MKVHSTSVLNTSIKSILPHYETRLCWVTIIIVSKVLWCVVYETSRSSSNRAKRTTFMSVAQISLL